MSLSGRFMISTPPARSASDGAATSRMKNWTPPSGRCCRFNRGLWRLGNALGKQALRPKVQHQDQRHADQYLAQRRELDRLQPGEPLSHEPRRFKEDDDEIGAKHRAAGAADPAGRDGEEDIDRDQRLKMIGRDVGLVMGIESAGECRDRGRDGERLKLESEHVLAGKGGELLIFADRLHGASKWRAIETAEEGRYRKHDQGD